MKNLLFLSIILMLSACQKEEKLNEEFGEINHQFRQVKDKNFSPYAMFGDSSFVLMTEEERKGTHILEIENRGIIDQFSSITFDFQTGKVELLDTAGNVIKTVFGNPEDIARFIKIDRFASKYSDMTPYHYAGNNPIFFIDVNGDSLDIGGHMKQAQKDINSLVREEYRDRISFNDNRVHFDQSGLTTEEIESQSGLALIIALTTSDEQYLYEVVETSISTNRKTGEQIERKLEDIGARVQNLSVTPRLEAPFSPSGAPKEGYDGQVSIVKKLNFYEQTNEGTLVKKARPPQVFHELQENYERTTNKLPYKYLKKIGGKYVNDNSKVGAHQKAINKESNFHAKSHQPGVIKIKK